MIFVLFALVFQSWLFAFIGFHYLLTFALVFYQLRMSGFPVITRVVYNLVTPFAYIFDFCVNWLEGPSRYWFLICYVPMYSENVLMSGLVLWYASTSPSPAWYMVPGCVGVIVMFPLGVLAQFAYYYNWHPSINSPDNKRPKTTRLHRMTCSEFHIAVEKANLKRSKQESRPIAQMTARCAHCTGAQKMVGTP